MLFVILDVMPFDRWGEDGFTHATGYAQVAEDGLLDPTYEGDFHDVPIDGDEVIDEAEYRARFFGEDDED